MKKLKVYDYTQEELAKFAYAVIKTNKGEIKAKLYPEQTPNTVANFASLANDGFYDGLTFHRVIPGFVAQGGCPYGTGTGGPDWKIACECDKNTTEHKKGTLSMAHAGKDTGGSQFFICHAPLPHLDGLHTIFGDIVDGDEKSFEVLKNIKQNDIIENISIKETL